MYYQEKNILALFCIIWFYSQSMPIILNAILFISARERERDTRPNRLERRRDDFPDGDIHVFIPQ